MIKVNGSENFTFSISVHRNPIVVIIKIITIRTPRTEHAVLYEDYKQQAQLQNIPERIQ
jgi:fumarate reductase subunit C